MIERARRAIIRETLHSIRRLYGSRPVPLGLLHLTHRWIGRGNADLIDALERFDPSVDPWAMHPEAMGFLEDELARCAPSYVLEFGSGISTLVIARHMDRAHPEQGPRVFSIEQDERWASKVRDSLEEEGVSDTVQVVVVPLQQQNVWGVETTCYALSEPFLDNLLGGVRPDLLLIDGPSAEPGSRFGTLPLIAKFINDKATFYLDDALRRSELDIGMAWRSSGRIQVDGVHVVGRGILSGHLSNPGPG